MNNKYFKKYILLAFAAIISLSAIAQDEDYARVNKTATYDYEKQEGEITLESYVTGVMKVTQEAKPIDVVMVLDYSTSMKDAYSSSDTYTKVVATKRYYAQNTKVTISSSTNYVSNQTTDITGAELKNSSGTKITVDYNGSTKQVYLIRRGSGSDSKNWCYVDDGGTRVFIRMDGSFIKEKGTATITSTSTTWPKGVDGYTIVPAISNDRIFFCELGQTSGVSITTRTAALQAAAASFIDNIADHATDNNVTDRVSVIVFQGGGTSKYPAIYKSGTDYDTDYTTSGKATYLAEYPTDKKGTFESGSTTEYAQDGSLQGRSFVAKRFVDLSSQNAKNILKFAINDVKSSGNTNVADGLTLASLLISSSPRSDDNLAKIVVIFSDGDPTDDKNTSIGLTHTLKDKDWLVYTIYCHSSDPKTATGNFMNYMSSNYPDAESTTKPGDKITPEDKAIYYKTAKDDLKTIFDKLTTEITTMAGVKYGTETLLKDFVNNTYFKMPDDIDEYDVKVYEQACTGVTVTATSTTYTFNQDCIDKGTGANRLWHKGSDENPTSPIEIKIVRADPNVSGSQDQVLITGYDYSADANWCGLRKDAGNPSGTPGGHRLLVKFPYVFKTQSGSTATGSLETNGSNSGIYEAKEDSSGKKPGESGYTPTYDSEPATEYPMPVVYFCALVINRTGLDKGESAIYDIFQKKAGESTETKVGRLSLNGDGSTTVTKVLYGLAGGVGVSYRVQETDWNWAYHSGGAKPEFTQVIGASPTDPTVPAASSFTFDFGGAHVEPTAAEEPTSPYSKHNHDEDYQVNSMTIPPASSSSVSIMKIPQLPCPYLLEY